MQQNDWLEPHARQMGEKIPKSQFLVPLPGIEPGSQASEAYILSVELQGRDFCHLELAGNFGQEFFQIFSRERRYENR